MKGKIKRSREEHSTARGSVVFASPLISYSRARNDQHSVVRFYFTFRPTAGQYNAVKPYAISLLMMMNVDTII